MKSKKLTKILLSIVMVLSVCIGIGIYILETAPKMDNLVGMTKYQAIKWLNSVDYTDYVFETVDSETIDKNLVAEQSIEPGEYLNGTLILYLSNGPKTVYYELPEELTYDNIKKWETDNKLSCIEYVYEDSDADKDSVLRVVPNEKITAETKVTVYLSKGPEEKEKEPNKYVFYDDYLGYSESWFVNKMNNLGLYVRETEPCYSFTIDENCIWDYTQGYLEEGDTMSYTLSRGPYVFNEAKYIGLDENSVEEYVENLNSVNARIKLSFREEYNSADRGIIYHAIWWAENNYNYVVCYISLGEEPGTDEAPAVITTPEPEAEEEKEEDETKEEETVPVQTAFIPAMNVFESMVFSTAGNAETALKEATLSKFTNVTYIKENTRDYLVGCIYKIEVNGSDSYEPGQYNLDTPIVVYISNGF